MLQSNFPLKEKGKVVTWDIRVFVIGLYQVNLWFSYLKIFDV